jgi:hypothetical protein
MSGRQGSTSRMTQATSQLQRAVAEVEAARSGLQATEAQTEQIAQIAQAVAAAMDKIATTSQEMAEHAAQLRSLPQASTSGAAVLPLAPPREPTRALADWVVPTEAYDTIAAASQRRGDTSGRRHRNPASRLIETFSPARLRAVNGTHKTQERAPRLRDDRPSPTGSGEIAAANQTATLIPLPLGQALPADHQDLAEVTPAATYAHRKQELDLLDWTISNLFHVGLILLPAARHGETARETAEALQCLDDTICRIRDHVSDAHASGR